MKPQFYIFKKVIKDRWLSKPLLKNFILKSSSGGKVARILLGGASPTGSFLTAKTLLEAH